MGKPDDFVKLVLMTRPMMDERLHQKNASSRRRNGLEVEPMRYVHDRRCGCGAVLSTYNPADTCWQCTPPFYEYPPEQT